MAFINKDGLQYLTNKLVKAENIKVASLRGSNIKEVIDNIQRECDNIAQPNTMQIENNVSIFKAGQGNNVNVSNDIEDGISSFEFKGISYKNLCKDNVKYVSSNDEYFSFEDNNDFMKIIKKDGKNPTWGYWRNYRLNFNSLKPQTVYTLIVRIDCNYSDKIYPSAGIRYGDGLNVVANFSPLTKKGDYYIGKITTIQDFSSVSIDSNLVIYFTGMTPQKINDWVLVYKKMMLIEGDLTNNPINSFPGYFEDIKSSFENKAVDIEVTGANILENKIIDAVINSSGTVTAVDNGGGWCTIPVFVKKGVKYYINRFTDGIISGNRTWGAIYNAPNLSLGLDCIQNVGDLYDGKSFIPNQDGWFSYYFNNNTVSDGLGRLSKEQALSIKYTICENNPMKKYEPYNKKKISFDIGEPLRSLPNGISDEIVNNNGEWQLFRRIGKKILNGTETSWNKHNYSNNNFSFFYIWEETAQENSSAVLCNEFSQLEKAAEQLIYENIEGIWKGWTSGRSFFFWIKNSRLQSSDIDGFKLWLQQHPVVVYYELLNPIITPIKPLLTEASQGTTIKINSEIAPYSSHTVILNRSGQIEQGIELIAELRSKIDDLEREYDNNLLKTQLRINDLKLNLKLKGDK